MSSSAEPKQFMRSSGATDAVWIHLNPYSERPQFSSLTKDSSCEVCIIGAGIAGISTAYELVSRGKQVILLDAREVLSGETGRTSGHLNSDLDDEYIEIAEKHGKDGAQLAAQSHAWARDRIGEITQKLGIECEYRKLPAYDFSQYPRGDERHEQEIEQLKKEAAFAKDLGLEAEYRDGLACKGWDGKIDQRDGVVYANQATFHPTKYLVGILKWLQKQPNFQCYTHTRVISVDEQNVGGVLGIGSKGKVVTVQTEEGRTVECDQAVEATCVPLQKLSLVAEMEFDRTYCIAVRVPKGSVEDCLIYDQAEHYKYVRLTACDDSHDYLVVGGCDHKVGQEETAGRFEELEKWTRERFSSAGSVDYKWSGQIFEPVDFLAFIGKNQGRENIYVVTGDSGDGLTHGVMASKIIADQIEDIENPWSKLYSPTRLSSIAKSLKTLVTHDVQINTQYKRFLKSDIKDIEDLAPNTGGVLNPTLEKPIAVYKDGEGNVHEFSALCPHMQGVVCWNGLEQSWDCPVHGSRFSREGICVEGPAKGNLAPKNERAERSQKAAMA